MRLIWLIATAFIVFSLALASSLAANEYRILPVTGWEAGFLKQADVDKLLGVPGDPNSKGDVRNANLNAVLVEVRRRADVCYPSALGEPCFSDLSPSTFNALQAMIRAAHDTTDGKKRIEVHCWVVAFRTGTGDVYDRHSDPSNPDTYWMTMDNSGVESSDKAFDPGHPKAEQYTVDVCMDLVNNFDIDGIHFDYIRYTGATQGYNPTSIARYNARYGTTGQPDSGDERFKAWRRDQVTAVVRKVYAKVQASKPWVIVSGSFGGGTPSPTASTREAFQTSAAYCNSYQDWDSWVHEGIVDMAVPMTYFDLDTRYADYQNWINFQKDRKANRLMVTDAGTYLNDIDDAINMLSMTREASPAGNHSDGFGIYSYQSPYVDGSTYGPWSTFNSRLLASITPAWADVPQMPWKTSPTKGHIGGTVSIPPSGTWADGASVKIQGPENRSMLCDGTGFYAFIDVAPGVYTITADYGAFETIKTVTVTAGHIADGDISLTGTDPTPPVIADVQVSSITDGTAEVTWTTDDPSTSQVEYDFVPHYGQSSIEQTVGVTQHSVTLQGLNYGTAYHLRVKSVNAAGLTGYSNDVTFTTQPLASDVTVDELDSHCFLSGSWIATTSSSGWNGSYRYHGGVAGDPTCTATWAPPLPRSGPYDVYVYYREGSNRTTQATYTINYASGSMQTTVDQSKAGSKWVRIGTALPFTAGESGSVVLTNQVPDAKIVVADAVQFRYGGDTTPAVMSQVTTDRYTTSTQTLHASWLASDAESAIAGYRYAVGTQPGTSDVKAWTDAGSLTSATISGLSLVAGGAYYVSVRATNSAGLTSAPMTAPAVTVAHNAGSIAEAKTFADGQPVCVSSAIVTGVFPGRFYIQDANRTSAIRVEANPVLQPNQQAQVYGVLTMIDGCERALTDCQVIPGSVGPAVRPLGMVVKAIGSPATSLSGLSNVGMLVRVAGRVSSSTDPDGFHLSDGSAVSDETGVKGIRIWTGQSGSASFGARLGVTGIVSCRRAGEHVYPVILMREKNTL